MKFCVDMSFCMSRKECWQRRVVGLQEGIMEDVRLLEKYSKMDYGGQQYMETPHIIPKAMMYVKGMETHHEEMRCR